MPGGFHPISKWYISRIRYKQSSSHTGTLHDIHVILDDKKEPWFVGWDVAKKLGYTNTRDALAKHVDGDDKLTSQIETSGQRRDMTLINESGLYSLSLSSKMPTLSPKSLALKEEREHLEKQPIKVVSWLNESFSQVRGNAHIRPANCALYEYWLISCIL